MRVDINEIVGYLFGAGCVVAAVIVITQVMDCAQAQLRLREQSVQRCLAEGKPALECRELRRGQP